VVHMPATVISSDAWGLGVINQWHVRVLIECLEIPCKTAARGTPHLPTASSVPLPVWTMGLCELPRRRG